MKSKSFFKINQFALHIVICLLLSSSYFSSIKAETLYGGKNLYKTFYVGDEGVQYFIKPLKFKSNNNSGYILIDFIFRNKGDENSTVALNYSFFEEEFVKNIDSLIIVSNDNVINCSENSFIFKDKDKSLFVLRNKATTLLTDLKSVFKNENWLVKVYGNNKEYLFIPSGKTKKALKNLNNNLFVLFN